MSEQPPQVIPVYPQQKTANFTRIFVIGIVIIACIIAFGLAMKIAFSGIAGGIPTTSTGRYEEKVVDYGTPSSHNKVVVVDFHGNVEGVGSYAIGDGPVFETSRMLRQAAKDSSVKAVVIQMDSPGGGLTASDVIYNEVKRVKDAGKPIVVAVSGLAASGGYYISAPADYIIASPTSLIGSIGVIMMRFELQELLGKLGIKSDPIKSTGSKDIGSPFRPLTPDERKFFENLLESFHTRFVTVISEGRNMPVDDVRKLANGYIYTADEALKFKLIDQIGYFDKALNKARELANVDQARYIRYEKPFDFQDIFKDFGKKKLIGSEANLSDAIESLFLDKTSPRLMALWTGWSDTN